MILLDECSQKRCDVCISNLNDVPRFGRKYKVASAVVHYNCMLLSPNARLRFVDSDGQRGFVHQDVLHLIQQSSRVQCAYCSHPGASMQCHTCKTPFHLPCGVTKGASPVLPHMYCAAHSTHQNTQARTTTDSAAGPPVLETSINHQVRNSAKDLMIHNRTDTDDYKCDFGDCFFAFKRLSALNGHKRNHSLKRSYKCVYGDCAAEFKSSASLRRHKQSHTSKLPHRRAEDCSTIFDEKRKLVVSIRPLNPTLLRMYTVADSNKLRITQDTANSANPYDTGASVPVQLKGSRRLQFRKQLGLRSISSKVFVDQLMSASACCDVDNYQSTNIGTRESDGSVMCSIDICLCADGRNMSEEGTMWEILVCSTCGSRGAHRRCADLLLTCSEWKCQPLVSTAATAAAADAADAREAGSLQEATSTPIKYELNIGELLIDDIKKAEEVDPSYDSYSPQHSINSGEVLIGDIKKE